MNATAMPNRHPVDQLADVREQIKSLKTREDALRDEVSAMMGNADSLGGDEFIAHQSVSTRKGAIDQKALEATGIDVDKFRKPDVTAFTIRVERRAMEEV